MPVTPENMNYVSVVFIGLVLFVVVLWFATKRGEFKGPQVNLELMNERRLAALHTETINLGANDLKATESQISYVN